MDNRAEVKAFLTTRRARVTPDQVGLTGRAGAGRHRRVPGLRRSEVADLAGVSVEYYAQLERGNLAGVSDSVLDSLARALRLDDAERAHLSALAGAAGPARRITRRPRSEQVRPGVQRLIDRMDAVPVIVNNARLDTVAANALGRALFAPVWASATRAPGGPVNHARFTFLDPGAAEFWTNWERAADDSVAQLRTEAGRDPHDKALSDLVGELSTRSEAFGRRWAAHDVRLHRTGSKDFRHPVVGALHLDFEALELPADPGLLLITFTAPTGSPDDDALALLGSWAANRDTTSTPLG